MGSEILAFYSHFSANFQPILDCFIPKLKLEYVDLENIKIDRVNTVVFNLHQIEQSKFFGTPGSFQLTIAWSVAMAMLLLRSALPKFSGFHKKLPCSRSKHIHISEVFSNFRSALQD